MVAALLRRDLDTFSRTAAQFPETASELLQELKLQKDQLTTDSDVGGSQYRVAQSLEELKREQHDNKKTTIGEY